ncbi:MAG TPA: thiamine pyrophosphate-binding protein [Burkholderiales bacterium]|nr:thiamine pyrophosphate-binding protein [Burkholderiales bacterium]
MKSSLRGADLLARSLVAAGTRHLFALSGNHVMPVFDAALDTGLELIHVRHEAAAVHMADAWGRLTGEPGIALVTGGPGHANAVGALYTALASESPLVLISGHAPLGELGKGAFQEMAQAAMAAPVTKASWTAQSAETLAADVVKAWREAKSGTPGPVHLSIPNDVLDAAVDTRIPTPAQFAVPKEKAEEVDTLGAAQRPLVIAGPAMMRKGTRELEETTGIPVIGMESPRGANDPSLGRLGGILARADLVLLLGKRVDFTLKFGQAFAQGARVVQAQSVRGIQFKNNEWLDEVRAALRYRPPEWRAVQSKAEGPIHPVTLCRAVQPLLDKPGAVLVSDGGEFGQWAQACLSAPRRLINGPAGSIGSALPFAAAAKLAHPDSPVVAMLGDGTLGFHLSEIDTAVRHGLGYVAVIGNDATWNAEYQIQLRAYGSERAKGCELLPTRYGAVARALGAHGEDVERPGELQAALQRAVASGKPACVNVMIERLAAPKY